MKKRILLIQCGLDERYSEAVVDGFDLEGRLVQRAPVTPLGCATLAALTPDHYEVHLWDEDLHGQIRADTPMERYDIVGISVLYSALAYQARFLGLLFQGTGATVVAGGPAISAGPEELAPFFDALFVNEAERTWPEFLRDYEQGTVRKEYRQIDKPEMTESPPPRWDAIAADIPRYEWASVQTTRGCPFDCEFCDVIYLYGRRQRHKPIEQVVGEVATLERLGAWGIFLADDELIGDPPRAKRLLRALIPLQNSFRRPLPLITQLTMNLSRDPELLDLCADANLYSAVLGVESLSRESLRETRKHQNIREDLIADLCKIHRHGIGPRAGFIVGFDHDGLDVFDNLYEGIQRACIPWVVLNTLQAPQGTAVWKRLHAEGRLVSLRKSLRGELASAGLQIQPARMTRIQLLEGFRDLALRLHTWPAVCDRIRGWTLMVRRIPQVNEPLLSEAACDRWLDEAARAWPLSDAERALLADTVALARGVAPSLVLRVVFFLAHAQTSIRRYRRLFLRFDQMLDAEREGDLVPDHRRLILSTELGDSLTDVFPELYARLRRSLPDARALPEAARDVLVDFVARWGSEVTSLEEHHREFLFDLCDRAAAKRGGQPAEVSAAEQRALVAEGRRSRLIDGVLKDVRDELALVAAR
jgi:radical SAM superfamily enzyme YgiQ (UPF0313 family)